MGWNVYLSLSKGKELVLLLILYELLHFQFDV